MIWRKFSVRLEREFIVFPHCVYVGNYLFRIKLLQSKLLSRNIFQLRGKFYISRWFGWFHEIFCAINSKWCFTLLKWRKFFHHFLQNSEKSTSNPIFRNWFTNSNSKTMLLATVFVSIFHFPPLSVISMVGVETVAAFLMRYPTPNLVRKSSYFSSLVRTKFPVNWTMLMNWGSCLMKLRRKTGFAITESTCGVNSR